MADLATHLSVTAVVVGMGASAYLGAGLVSPREALLLWAAGTLGGVLPDLDADHSGAVRAVFGVAGIVAGSLAMVAAAGRTSILEMWLLFGLVYVVVRYLLRRLFVRRTRHRGALHSVAAALCCAALSVVVAGRYAGVSGPFSWLFGVALFAGFLLHLVLDEVSSVDLVNVRMKTSFGSALKLVDREAPLASIAMVAVAAVCLLVWAPAPRTARDVLCNGRPPVQLWQRFWPERPWPAGIRVRWSAVDESGGLSWPRTK